MQYNSASGFYSQTTLIEHSIGTNRVNIVPVNFTVASGACTLGSEMFASTIVAPGVACFPTVTGKS
jgi:hypothetical protein